MAYIVPIPLWVPVPPSHQYAQSNAPKVYYPQPNQAPLTPSEQQCFVKAEPVKDQPSILSPIESTGTNLPPELARSRLTHPKSVDYDAPRLVPLPAKTLLSPTPQVQSVSNSAPAIAPRPEALTVHPPFGREYQINSLLPSPGQNNFSSPPPPPAPPMHSSYYAYPQLCQLSGSRCDGPSTHAPVLGQAPLIAPPPTLVHHLVPAAPPRAPVSFEYKHYPPPHLRALPNHRPQGNAYALPTGAYPDSVTQTVTPRHCETSLSVSRGSAGSIAPPELDSSISSSSSSSSPSPQNSPPKAALELPARLNAKSSQSKSKRLKVQTTVAAAQPSKPNGGSGRVGKQPVRDPVKLMHRVWLQQNRVYQDKLRVAGFRVLEGVNGNKICSLCSKQFPKEMFVWRHALSHVDEKPFHCTVCDQKFTRSDTLQRHIRRAGHQSIAGNVN